VALIMWSIVALILMPVGYMSYRLYAFLPIALTLIMAIAWCRHKAQCPLALHLPALILILGIIILSAVSLLWAEFDELSQRRIVKMTPVLLGGIVPLCFVKARAAPALIVYKLAFGLWALTLALMLVDIELNVPIYGLLHDAVVLLPQLNRYAIVLLIGYIFVCAHAPRKITLMLAVPMAVFLWKTDSQSVQLTALLLLGFICVWPLCKKYMVYIFGGAITLLTVSFPWLAQWLFMNRPDTLSGILAKGAPYSRMEIWDAIAAKILDNPIMGYGLENIRNTRLEMDNLYWRYESVLHPHNYALQIWVEFGVIGVCAFLAWMWWSLLKIKRFSMAEQKLAFALILCIFSINLTAYGLWQSWWIGLTLLTWMSFYVFRPGDHNTVKKVL
jgi:O-antigen ligase